MDGPYDADPWLVYCLCIRGMVMRKIEVWNRMNACAIEGKPDTAVISICKPDDPAPLREGWLDVLPLFFHDVDPSWGKEALKDFTLFGEAHVDAIFSFAEQHKERDMMIHCDAGLGS